MFSCSVVSGSLRSHGLHVAYQAPLSLEFSRQEQYRRCKRHRFDPWGRKIPWRVDHSLSLIAKSCPTLATPWTIACQTPLSMGFSRQHYWSGLPFPFSRGSSWPRNLHCRQVLYQLSYEGRELPYDPAIPLLDIHPREMKTFVHVKTCTWRNHPHVHQPKQLDIIILLFIGQNSKAWLLRTLRGKKKD